MVKRSSRGTSTIEYALMVAALAGGTAAVTMGGLGPAVQQVFQDFTRQLTDLMPHGGSDGGGDPTNGPGNGTTSTTPSPSATPSPTDIPTPTP